MRSNQHYYVANWEHKAELQSELHANHTHHLPNHAWILLLNDSVIVIEPINTNIKSKWIQLIHLDNQSIRN